MEILSYFVVVVSRESSRSTMATAAPADSIEVLFRPSTRFRDAIRNTRDRLLQNLTEAELLPGGLTIENVLAAVTTGRTFSRFAEEMGVVWMTPGVYLCCREIWNIGDTLVCWFGGRAVAGLVVRVTPGTAAAGPSTFAAASEPHDVYIRKLSLEYITLREDQ